METLGSISLVLGGSWASGINLYMTVAGLGIAQRLHLLTLPGNLDTFSHPLVIAGAILMYAVEFVADKIPVVDSIWDSVHTLIRPAGGAALGYLAAANLGPLAQVPITLLSAAVSADAHLTKATSRVAINSSAIPFANVGASVGEDIGVAAVLYFVVKHPVIAIILVIAFIAFSIWFLRLMWRFLLKVLRFFKGGSDGLPGRLQPSQSEKL